MDIVELALETLAHLPSHADPDEFAYLVLTTKSEQPIRDRWGYLLHKRLGSTVVVAREWCRADLAILCDAKPRLLIELTAMYTFDAASEPANYLIKYMKKMEADEAKARLLSRTAEIITVLLVTDPQAPTPAELQRVIKYHGG